MSRLTGAACHGRPALAVGSPAGFSGTMLQKYEMLWHCAGSPLMYIHQFHPGSLRGRRCTRRLYFKQFLSFALPASQSLNLTINFAKNRLVAMGQRSGKKELFSFQLKAFLGNIAQLFDRKKGIEWEEKAFLTLR
jgi:hypothetical protein